jgi:hypothetical protein
MEGEMSRANIVIAVVIAGAFAALCCVGQSSSDTASSALLAVAGTTGQCSFGGTGVIDPPAVRGYTRADGQHEAVFHELGTSNILRSVGTPLSNLFLVAGGAMSGSNAWGYKRHDGPDIRLYIDQNGHIHEVGSGDTDFNTCCGINAPIAASKDIVGYVHSDPKSGLVYRSSNNHVIEVTSNFSGFPPWVSNDLTTIASAPVTAQGRPFPYVRSDGLSAIVYKGSDNHIHELSNTGPAGWSDTDLYVISHETVSAATDPWGYKRSDNKNAVLFIGGDSKLHELEATTNDWSTVNLPAVTPASFRPSGYVSPTGVNSVVYISGGFTGTNVLHQLTLSGTTWTDEVPSGANGCVRPLSEPFGHAAPGTLSSILFLGREPLNTVKRYELSKLAGGAWSITSF